jgi:hypothetical protein
LFSAAPRNIGVRLSGREDALLVGCRDRLLSAERGNRLRDFLALSREQLWECDAQFNLTWHSPDEAAPLEACSTLCAFVSGQARIRDLDGRPLVDGRTLRCLLDRRERFSQCVVQCQRHATPRYLELAGIPQWSAGGRFLGYRGTTRDRTEWIRLWQASDCAPS